MSKSERQPPLDYSAVKVSGCNEHLFRQQTIRLLHALFGQKF